jgi:hypothetical protein
LCSFNPTASQEVRSNKEKLGKEATAGIYGPYEQSETNPALPLESLALHSGRI